MRTGIVVEENILDMNDELQAQLTFAIDDVKEYASRNSSYSKTVVIPGTAQNNFIFGHIFQLDVFNTHNPDSQNVGYNYNAAKSAKCEVYVDYMILFKGVIRVLEIKIADGFIEYECSLVGELGGLAYAIEGKKLEELDFSAYDHDYLLSEMQASWAAPLGSGVFYPLIDYGEVSTDKRHYQYKALRPALYVKEYLDKIFTAAGYTYESAFLNGDYFKTLIVPNNQSELSNQSTRALYAAADATTYNSSGTVIPVGFTASVLGAFTYSGSAYTYTGASSISTGILLTIVGRWTQGGSAQMTVRLNGVAIDSKSIGTGFSSNYFSLTFNIPDVTIATSDVLDVVVTQSPSQAYTLQIISGTLEVEHTSASLVPINYGEAISINATIPKNETQKDFIVSIVKMFNLYIYEDRDKAKHLKIEPYINFYNTTELLDWTNKLDYSKGVSIKPLSEINSRKYEYRYKDDSDYYNDLYKKKYNTAYGNRTFDTTYEFVKDTKSVDVIFAPTPLVQAGSNYKILSTILKKNPDLTEAKTASRIRILTRSESLLAAESWNILNGASVLLTTSTYPYAGHLDNPVSPLLDLNFGSPEEFYFTFTGGYLFFNLFNVYWSAYMGEIADKDSKMLTAFFRLTTADIQALDFAKFIFIGGQLFRLNQVEDYNVADEEVTKVELLNVINRDFGMGNVTVTPAVGEFNDDFNNDFNIGG